MKRTTSLCLVFGALVAVGLVMVAGRLSAEEPKVSTFAPAEDLAAEASGCIEQLEDAVKDESGFDDAKAKIAKDANTLVVIALALGMHDKDNAFKNAAPAMIKAAQELAAAKDHAAAKAAVDALKAASKSKAAGADKLKWEKVASLPELMQAVPLINTKLKKATKGSRFEKKLTESAGQSAVLAAIAQGTIANSGDTKKPDKSAEWTKFCVQMRDAAGAVNASIHAKDQKATEAGIEKMTKACDECHAVFNEEAKATGEKE
jgi:hypothetical protein